MVENTSTNGPMGHGSSELHNSNGVALSQASMPPLNIPQSNNIAPTAVADGQSQDAGSSEPNKKALYVGGLDPRVTEEVLRQVFETTGHVSNVKVIPEKGFQSKGYNYGFVEYTDPAAADRAMQTLNGRRIHQSEIRVNWAYQSNSISATKEDTASHNHIFVGDLSNEVNDEVLLQAFSTFGTVSEARVMWDMKTGRSRGYGFVAFRERAEAEAAIAAMDGEWLGSRAIRCNWANQKGQPSFGGSMAAGQQSSHMMPPLSAVGGMTPMTPYANGGQPQQHGFPTQGAGSYDMVVQQTPQWQTTVYVGNLTPYTTQNDLVPLFANFGYVTETRFQSDRGFAFVKMDTHENAATAICQLNGYQVNGRPLKCSWGKDRPPAGQHDNFSPAAAVTPHGFGAQTPQGYGFPQYSAPNGISSPQGYGQPYGMHPGMNQYGQMPQSAGGYGRGQPAAGYMNQGQAYGAYTGY